MQLHRLLLLLLLLFLLVLKDCQCKRRWTYELIDAYGFSDDETKLNLKFYIERKGRYLVGMSGFIDWQYDIDNTTMIEVKILYSNSGGKNDYRPIPMAIPERRLIDIKNVYDDIIYPILKDCSNLPRLEGDLFWPWPKDLYKFNMCNFDKGNLPEILAEGFYKVEACFSGQVSWNVTYAVSIKTKLI